VHDHTLVGHTFCSVAYIYRHKYVGEMGKLMKRVWWQFREMLNLVFQVVCPLCQRGTAQAICQDCQKQIQRCQLAKPDQLQIGRPPVFAWGQYGGTLKQAIAALKYNNHPELAYPLAHWMGTAWLQAVPTSASPAIVVPIPMYAEKQRQRGFNQADLLAEGFCQITRLPLEVRGLERIQETKAQFTLASAMEREQNLEQAFRLGNPFLQRPPSRPVLLLDDIYTTGATVRSAIQTLRRHGIRVEGIVVLARAGMNRDRKGHQ